MTPADAVDRASAPGHLLRRAQQVHTDRWTRTVDGVTGPQYAVLVAAAGWPGLEQKRAGELASLDKSTAAGIVSRLGRAGWIDRQPDPADRRRRRLMLTAAARGNLGALTAAARAVQDFLLSPLAPSQQEGFIDSLGSVARVEESGILDQRPDGDVLIMARTPGYLIRRAQQLHTAYWSGRVRDLTGPQYAVMTATLQAGVATPAQIGAAVSLDSSTIGNIIERLISQGWLEPVPGPDDRRSRPVRATRPAGAAVRLLGESVSEVQQQLIAPVPVPDRTDFIIQLRQIARLPLSLTP